MSKVSINIDLPFHQLLEVVRHLSPKEKLLVNNAIWNENMDIPVEHQMLVLERKEEALQNPEKMLDWSEASKKLIS